MTTNKHNLNDGGPAFPETGLSGLPNGEFIYGRAGMTLRDYFAAQALIIAWHSFDEGYTASFGDGDALATYAYILADAMLKARQS